MKPLIFPTVDPVAFHLGPFSVHWYGLMYLFGFMLIWYLMLRQSRTMQNQWSKNQIEDIIFYGAMGVVIGGRIGYMLFYNFSGLIENPLSLLAVWQGGMSFHGGAIGVAAMMYWLSRKQKRSFHEITDFLLPYVPLGLALGRMGNFINGELWGSPTSLPWGMVFPHVDPLPRHPSQIYEFLLEGVLLFLVLRFYASKPRPPYAISGLFLVGYGCVRFVIEFFRVPDRQLGYLAMDWLTMGQILSLPMILIGIVLMMGAYLKWNSIHISCKQS